MESILIGAIVLPFIAAIFVMLCMGNSPALARWVALAVSLLTMVAAFVLIAKHIGVAAETSDYVLGFERSWLAADSPLDVRFSVGLDGVSLWLFGLSALLMVTAVLVSWTAIDHHESLFYSMLLLLLAGCMGVFAARDLLLFYVFFEFTLIPLFFLIGIWGSEERRYAANKFFLFTLAGSLLTFLGLLTIVLWHYTQSGSDRMIFSIPELTAFHQANPMSISSQWWVFSSALCRLCDQGPVVPIAHLVAVSPCPSSDSW